MQRSLASGDKNPMPIKGYFFDWLLFYIYQKFTFTF